MKKINVKTLIITCFVTLAPILLGIALYDKLPDMMAIHFDINNNPDNFAPKAFTVFGLPLILLGFQIFTCIVVDIAGAKADKEDKFSRIGKWVIPAMSLVIYPATIFFSLGNDLDIRRIAVLIVGILFVVMGNYMPKANHIQIMGKMREVSGDTARKFLRLSGYITFIYGLLFLATLFFPPIASVIVLLLLIPYTIVAVIFGIKISKGE